MDNQAFEGLMISDPTDYIAVVAIDFGTTYSGFAFAFNHKEGEGGIHMNKAWGNEQGYSTLKTPTSLLLRPGGQFDSFGFEADEKYANFLSGEDQEYMYFKRFKMALHKSESLDRNTKMIASNGRELDALAVFSHSIRYLKDRAIEIIREVTGDEGYNALDIQWVLTVPAIWKPAAKQFMREAAYMADIASADNPEQLLIALEPEAASIHCRDKKMKDFTSEQGDAGISDVFARPAAKYLVVDIGGGTLDVTAHEILTNGNMKEIFQVTGGPYGGTKVDEEFVSLLKRFFGSSVVESFCSKYPGEWFDLMNDFEMKKRGRRAFDGGTTRLRLPRTLTALISEHRGSAVKVEGVQFLRNEYLCLEAMAMKKLFEPVLDEILNHLTNLLQNRCLKDIQFFFLVGGFAQSALLQDAIKKQFSSRYKILVPLDASIAVVQGAVMFGQKPHAIESRIMSTTYGFGTNHRFDPKRHPMEKRHIVEGVALCKDCFVVLAKENEMVKVGEIKRFPNYQPLRESQTSVAFKFFTSTDPEAKYITDGVVGPSIGEVVVKSPDTSEGTNRRIDVCVYFGGTEIKVTAIDLTSRHTATAYLDFLCKR